MNGAQPRSLTLPLSIRHTLSHLSHLPLLVCFRRMYTKEGIDLLFRHYYKNSRA